MWYKVQELTREGLNKSQKSRETGLDRATVRRYQQMEEEVFHRWIINPRNLPKRLARYREFIKKALMSKPYLSAAQVEDRLKERYKKDLPSVHSKTVYNFVQNIRKEYGIKKPGKDNMRNIEKLPEPAWGKEAQVDFGESWLLDREEKRRKVYFFVISLSRSRYKYVVFSDKPYTSERAVQSHYQAFEYFQGVPREIIYDQDRVFIHDENLGDYLLSKAFSDFCKGQSFRPVFCRGSDPQSKGKIESVVKYVKQNFLRGRLYVISSLLAFTRPYTKAFPADNPP
ncbi:MAG: transposase [Bacteroidales bacterium]|nr:transposase [Bacteroidales bacterium]